MIIKKVTSNKSKKVYTIKTLVATYRSVGLTNDEFNDWQCNTHSDWVWLINHTDIFYKI